MDVTRAIQVAVVRVDMALCGAGSIILRAVFPALIAAVLLYVVVRCGRRK